MLLLLLLLLGGRCVAVVFDGLGGVVAAVGAALVLVVL